MKRRRIKQVGVTMLVSSMILTTPALAMTTTNKETPIQYVGRGTETYEVSVPSMLHPGDQGEVTLTGTWSTETTIHVVTSNTIVLRNDVDYSTKALAVHFDDIMQTGDNEFPISVTEQISIDPINDALFGKWTGHITYNIHMAGEQHTPDVIEERYQLISDDPLEISLAGYDDIEINNSEPDVVNVELIDDELIVTPIDGGIAIVSLLLDGEPVEFIVDVAHEYVDGHCVWCGEKDVTNLDAGLYDAHWNKIETWENLEANGVVHVYNGVLSTNYYWNEVEGDVNSSAAVLKGKLVLPEGITEIIDNCFFTCNELTDVVLPTTLEKIGSCGLTTDSINNIMVRNEDTHFKSVGGVLYDLNMTTIIEYPAHKLETHFTIPHSVTKINGGAFYKVHALESVVIPENVTYIGNRAFDETKLKELKLPSKVKYIGDFAFRDCTPLSKIELNDGLEHIGYWAFGGCWNVEKIFIPASVQTIVCNSLSDGTVFGPFVFCSPYLEIECEATSKPDGWDTYWNSYGYNNTPNETLLNVTWRATR